MKNGVSSKLDNKMNAKKNMKPTIHVQGAKSFQGHKDAGESYTDITVDLNGDGVVDDLDTKYWNVMWELCDTDGDGDIDEHDRNVVVKSMKEKRNYYEVERGIVKMYTDFKNNEENYIGSLRYFKDPYQTLRRFDLNNDGDIDNLDQEIRYQEYKGYLFINLDVSEFALKNYSAYNNLVEISKKHPYAMGFGTKSISLDEKYSNGITGDLSAYDNPSEFDDALASDFFNATYIDSLNFSDTLDDNVDVFRMLTDQNFLNAYPVDNAIRELFTLEGQSNIRVKTLDQVSFTDIIDILLIKKNKTDFDNAVVEAVEAIDEIRDYLDNKTAGEFEEVMKLVIIAHTMKNLLEGVDFDVINTALTHVVEECQKVYDEYMELSDASYKELAGILGIDLENDALPDEYTYLSKIPMSERMRILVDYAMEKIDAKGKNLSENESKARSYYQDIIVKLNETYQEKFKAVVDGFIFTVKKALMNAAPAAKSEDKKKFEAMFNLGALKD